MTLLLKPIDFEVHTRYDTLVKIIQFHEKGDLVISERAVPPHMHEFAMSKGCTLDIRTPLAADTALPSGRQIIPIVGKTWNINLGDVVRHKQGILNHGLQMNVLDENDILAEVDFIDGDEKWILKEDLEVLHKGNGSFKNAGEG